MFLRKATRGPSLRLKIEQMNVLLGRLKLFLLSWTNYEFVKIRFLQDNFVFKINFFGAETKMDTSKRVFKLRRTC